MEQREFYRRLRYDFGIGDTLLWGGVTATRAEHRVIVACGAQRRIVQVHHYRTAVERVIAAVDALLALPRKRCPTCTLVKLTTDFYRNRAKADGLSDSCKDCQNAATYKWRAEHRAYHNDWRNRYWRNRRAAEKEWGG